MSALSWRATFWFCFAFALSIFTYLFFFFPETYRVNEKFDLELPTTNNEKERTSSVSSETIDQPDEQINNRSEEFKTASKVETSQNENVVPQAPTKRSMNPFAAFLMLRHPFIFLSSIISGIAFGCMFAVETIIPDLYEKHYGFNAWMTGKDKKNYGTTCIENASKSVFLQLQVLVILALV